MVKRSQKLSPIVELAIKATEKALIKVGEANTAWIKDKQQEEELYSYKAEYLSRLRQVDNSLVSAQKVLELRLFLVSLDQAIAAQQQQVGISLRSLQHQQQLWQQLRQKEQAMNNLVSRYQQEEISLELKQEQQDNDERNTAQWVRKYK
ncbi:MAG: flagellar FliJ family protein [Piscirickettsiaceae bacterium]|nr:flagellar FliJ family protein [Piscirickettsiaceae bacterium]